MQASPYEPLSGTVVETAAEPYRYGVEGCRRQDICCQLTAELEWYRQLYNFGSLLVVSCTFLYVYNTPGTIELTRVLLRKLQYS